ncbi:MAG: hypothetical protein CW345_07670 [Firmicutes bacterium]|nr:hypothetical protein [Bacillota bacterium]MBO2521664.1 hypothetical protein [Bacillota bacterium]
MQLAPEAYFQLDGYAHRDLFAGVAYAWEVLQRLDGYLGQRLKPGVHGEVHPGAWVEGDVYIAPGAVVEAGAYVRGPVIIEEGAVVRHGAYVRGHCIIGAGCVVGHATELKRVIMLDGAQAPHFNYIGDSVLGRRVNLGAGTRLSNFKNDGSEVVVRNGTERIPTGMRKFGAIVGDDVKTGCNAVLSPGTLIGPRSMVYPNAVLRGVYPADHIVKLRQETVLVERSGTGW